MDLGYDNKIVAAKAWAALFATRDWALKAEKGLLEAQPEEPQKSWKEILAQLRRNQENKEKLEQWKPRDIKVGIDVPKNGEPELFADRTPEKQLAKYLNFWMVKNYGYMAQCLSPKMGLSAKQAPARLRQVFSSKALKSFEFVSVQENAAALSIISTNLVFEEYGEEVLRAFDFRLINEDSQGNPEVSGTPGSDWKIINWALY